MIDSNNSYEKYLREQLNSEQNKRLDGLMKKFGQTHLNDKGLCQVISDASGKERYDIEANFLIKYADLNEESLVFDACLGTGATSIGLKMHGIRRILSNDIDEEFIMYAEDTAKKQGLSLNVTRWDWREIWHTFTIRVDTVVCLGNSVTYIMQEVERQVVMDNFFSMLKPGGKGVFDTRNYTELLRGNFLNTGKGPYRNMGNIDMKPAYVSSDMVWFNYNHKDGKHDLLLYPLKDGELERLMINAGFVDLQVFGDYKKRFNPKTTEFYTYIETKP